MCIALRNTRAARPTARNNANGLNPATRTVPYIVGAVVTPTRPNNSNGANISQGGAGVIKNNDNVCKAVTYGSPMWGAVPLPFPPPGGRALVELAVSNSNGVLDDSWDFKVDGVTVANYDGGGATTLSFFAYLNVGESHTLSAECVGEQSDNLFDVTLSVNEVAEIETSIGGEGTVGEIQDLGTFNT